MANSLKKLAQTDVSLGNAPEPAEISVLLQVYAERDAALRVARMVRELLQVADLSCGRPA